MTSWGPRRGGSDQGGCGSEQGGRGRGCGLRKCTYCCGKNHTVEFCWELYGKPLALEELPSQSLPPTSKVVFIPEEEYNHLLSMQSNSIGSSSIATLAHQGTSTACLAT